MGEFMTGHLGVLFVWGTFVKGTFIPGSLTYFYGIFQVTVKKVHCLGLSWAAEMATQDKKD